MKNKYTILTGITPSGSGDVHIGNYLGVVKPFLEMTEKDKTKSQNSLFFSI